MVPFWCQRYACSHLLKRMLTLLWKCKSDGEKAQCWSLGVVGSKGAVSSTGWHGGRGKGQV